MNGIMVERARPRLCTRLNEVPATLESVFHLVR
jgi:hypothetical protein